MTAEQDKTSQSKQDEFAGDKPYCDIVMKGGITSGVVYPLALVELAKKYRLRNIGGTSAGAIAAAIAAAAEFNRARGGYAEVARLPDEIGDILQSLFQPQPQLRPLFNIFLAALDARGGWLKRCRMVLTAFRGYWITTVLGFAPAFILLYLILAAQRGWVETLVMLFLIMPVLLFGGLAIAFGFRLYRAFCKEIPSNGFGICTGLNQPGYTGPGLTEWLSDKLETISGRKKTDGSMPDTPFTFGDLIGSDPQNPDINLQCMTTNLSAGRPYRLPIVTDNENRHTSFFFREEEFKALFPEPIVSWMVNNTDSFAGDPRYRYFPAAERLPVIVAVRMSLSFPILLSAVPLYTRDFTLREEKTARYKPIKCWFSDGGISSNFPIHFFDQIWPSSPTFGIALDEYVQERHGDARVSMPENAGQGILLPVKTVTSLGGFLKSVLSAAKDWQDNMQSTLPGYRERVARIALDENEGGLNLSMPKELIDTLTAYGAEVGQKMGRFDFDEHRWRRFLVVFARTEAALNEMYITYKHKPPGPEQDSFESFLRRYPDIAASYRPARDGEWIGLVLVRMHEMMQQAEKWSQNPLRQGGRIPRPDTDMRITPRE